MLSEKRMWTAVSVRDEEEEGRLLSGRRGVGGSVLSGRKRAVAVMEKEEGRLLSERRTVAVRDEKEKDCLLSGRKRTVAVRGDRCVRKKEEGRLLSVRRRALLSMMWRRRAIFCQGGGVGGLLLSR